MYIKASAQHHVSQPNTRPNPAAAEEEADFVAEDALAEDAAASPYESEETCDEVRFTNRGVVARFWGTGNKANLGTGSTTVNNA